MSHDHFGDIEVAHSERFCIQIRNDRGEVRGLQNADKLTAVGIISGLAKQSLMKVSTTVIAVCMIQS